MGRHSVVRVDVRLYIHPLENTVCAEFVVCLQHYYLSVSVLQSPLSSCVVIEACVTLIPVTIQSTCNNTLFSFHFVHNTIM